MKTLLTEESEVSSSTAAGGDASAPSIVFEIRMLLEAFGIAAQCCGGSDIMGSILKTATLKWSPSRCGRGQGSTMMVEIESCMCVGPAECRSGACRDRLPMPFLGSCYKQMLRWETSARRRSCIRVCPRCAQRVGFGDGTSVCWDWM